MHLHAGSACGGAHRVQQRRALQRLPGHRNDDAAGGEVRLALCGGGSERLEGCACTQALALQHRQRPARVVVAPVDDISKPGLAAKHLALYRRKLRDAGATVDAAATAPERHAVGRRNCACCTGTT
ncbi:hypothetical protein G6F46_014663 [Rhizopus delemar]|nr:hypothetical protein G6F46_014663 [Rhizopus delemar]